MKGGREIPDYVRDALASVAQKLGFVSGQHTVDYDFRSGRGTRSVVSVFYRVTFREEPREDVTVLCKVPPTDADETLLTLFEREAFVYGKLLPAFEQFQRNRAVELGWPDRSAKSDNAMSAPEADEQVIAFGPRCYHAHCDVKRAEGIIVLEDVRVGGFSNKQKFEPMDYDHARLAMVQLGRFHAISLALKQQQPELFEQYRYMGDVTRERVLQMEGFEQTMEQAFESAIATLSPGDVGRREKLMRLRGNFAEELQNIGDAAVSEPFCVVCHGDYAGDNMMFSYTSGFPRRLVLLDWQLAKYGSPALDFVQTIFLSTDESFRRNHYDSMLQTYHNALVGHLERLGDESATEWFPLTVLMRLIKVQARQALVLGLLQIPLAVASEETASLDDTASAEQREDSSSVDISDASDAKYQTRMVQSIDEETSRVIVKFALGGAQESLNEYMVMLVSKEEYNKYARILNAAKYEEFKNREMDVKPGKSETYSGEPARSERTIKDDRRQNDRPPGRSVSPEVRRSRERDRYEQRSHRERREDESERASSAKSSKDRSRVSQKNHKHDHRDYRDHRDPSDRRRSPNGRSGGRSTRRSESASTSASAGERTNSDSDDDERERERRKHKKSSSSYVRTSSGTKKKSHKYKQRRERRDERDSSYDRRDRRRHGSGSESDDKHHKKKTKKSKKPRSRSRSRR